MKFTFSDLSTVPSSYRDLCMFIHFCPNHPAQHNLKSKIECCGAGAVILNSGSERQFNYVSGSSTGSATLPDTQHCLNLK